MSVFAEVVCELVLKNMEHIKRGLGEGFRQKESDVSGAKASVFDHSVDLESKYEDGECVGGGQIRLQGEFRVGHGSFFFFLNGRLCMFISDKWSGFYPVDKRILRF